MEQFKSHGNDILTVEASTEFIGNKYFSLILFI